MEQAYASLLVRYCLDVKPGDRVFIQTTTLAEPLLKAVFREALAAGAAAVEYDLVFRERDRLFLAHASDAALQYPPLLVERAMASFDCYLNIRAPFNLRELADVDPDRNRKRQEAFAPHLKQYFERTADRRLKRNLCQYPTDAAAQEAGMSLGAYEQFVYGACGLLTEDPIGYWLGVRQHQQRVVDYLNACTEVRFRGEGTDIQFSTKGRRWINSDGQTNMPSGEVYTSPVEDSVQGTVHFSYPGLYHGREVEGVTLWVRDGWIERWEAVRGKDFLDQIFALPGARRFGEAAIGTNYQIKQMTRNILFDEKIGGTVHMAIGQSYLQCGGQNESTVHWDMITDMTKGGEVWADGAVIYRDGRFVI
jgi:aminopeptidase